MYRRPGQVPAEDPYPTDKLAVTAAVAWITEHFGPPPAGTSFEPEGVDHSASGDQEPSDDADRGHTIVLSQCQDGCRVASSVIYIRGRTIEMASLQVVDVEPAPGTTTTIVSRQVAIQAMVAWLARSTPREPGATAEQLREFQATAAPRLSYVWVHKHNRDSDLPYETYAPQWQFHPGSPALVDAYTGRIWIDD